MVHKWLLGISNVIAVCGLAFFPGALATIETHPYLAFPIYLGAWVVSYLVCFLVMWIFFALVAFTIRPNKPKMESCPNGAEPDENGVFRQIYKKHNRFYDVVFAALLDSAVWCMGGRITVTGMEKLPKDKKQRFLFVSNHRSVYDTFIQVAAFHKYPMSFISKPENWNFPLGHRYMTRLRYMAINRESPRAGFQITHDAAEMIKSGECCVGVYPEGTRNRTAELLLDFKDGCFKSALWARCPIVIGVVHNSAQIRPRWPKITKVWFEIVDVLPYETIRTMKTAEIAELVRQKMLDSLARENPQALDLRKTEE